MADRIAAGGNRLLLEAVDHRHTDVLNTLAEVRKVLRDINHPAIGGMFDFNNCSDETGWLAGIDYPNIGNFWGTFT